VRVTPQSIRIVIPIRIGNLRGAGDAVALVAEPVKRAIRRLAPAWDCGSCDKRRDALNRAVAFSPRS